MTAASRAGIIAAPAGAVLAATAGYMLVAQTCDGGHAARAPVALLSAAILGLAVTALGLVSSFVAWRSSRQPRDSDIIPDQESVGAFLARAGMLTATVMLVGLVYLVATPFLIQACQRAW